MTDDRQSTGGKYRFVPAVRRGFRPQTNSFALDRPSETDPIEGPLSVGVEVSVGARPTGDGPRGSETASKRVRMYGPGDATGIDREHIVRVEPEPGTTEFPHNYFPLVEFDHPELPWLLSPETTADDAAKRARVRPWIALVVVDRDHPDVAVTGEGPGGLPVLETPPSELPPASETWAWAHAQVRERGEGRSSAALLDDDRDRGVSRLLCPRNLTEGTRYTAAVVPTFEPGRRVGLGRSSYPEDGGEQGGTGTDTGDGGGNGSSDGDVGDGLSTRPMGFAWTDDATDTVELPIYYTWEFTAGGESFETLIDRLTPRALSEYDIGVRRVDASHPGPDRLVADETIDQTGALKSPSLNPAGYGEKSELADLIDREGDPYESADVPIVGAPLYGQWYPDVDSLPDPSGPDGVQWLHDLNVDPTHRIAAGLGAETVRENQERYVAAAWEQAGEIRETNRLLQEGQFARAASNRVFEGVTAAVGADGQANRTRLLQFTRPIHQQIPEVGTGSVTRSLEEELSARSFPAPVLSPAYRRLTSPRGSLVRNADFAVGGVSGIAPTDFATDFAEGTVAPKLDEDLERRIVTLDDVAGARASETVQIADVEPIPLGDGGERPDGVPDEVADRTIRHGTAAEEFVVGDEHDFRAERFGNWARSMLDREPTPSVIWSTATPETLALRKADVQFESGLAHARAALSELRALSERGGTGGDRQSGSGSEADRVPAPLPGPTDQRRGLSPDTDLGGGPGPAGDVEALPPTELLAPPEWPRSDDGGVAEETPVADREADVPRTAAERAAAGEAPVETDRSRSVERPASGGGDVSNEIQRVRDRVESVGVTTFGPLDRTLDGLIRAHPEDAPHAITEDKQRVVGDLVEDQRRTLEALDRVAGGGLDGPGAGGDPPGDDVPGEPGDDLPGDPDDLPDGTGPREGPVRPDRPDLGPEDAKWLDEAAIHMQRMLDRIARLRDRIVDVGPPVVDPGDDGGDGVDRPDPISEAESKSLLELLDPEYTIPEKVYARLDAGGSTDGRAASDGGGLTAAMRNRADPLNPVTWSPSFPWPMSEALTGLSEEYLMPGVDDVPRDTMGAVASNPAFVEAYLAGINHEFSRELLWRRFPTDRRGTPFRTFWNRAGSPMTTEDDRADIDPIVEWADHAALGGNIEAPNVVVLVRGELLRRYPNTTIYMVKATEEEGARVPKLSAVADVTEQRVRQAKNDPDDDLEDRVRFPTFSGTIDPDITFLGFDITPKEAVGAVPTPAADSDGETDELGWFVVFEEPMGETRFGLDVDEDVDGSIPPVGVMTGARGSQPWDDVVPERATETAITEDGRELAWNGLTWSHLSSDGEGNGNGGTGGGGSDDDGGTPTHVSIWDSQPGSPERSEDETWRVTADKVGDYPESVKAATAGSETMPAVWGRNSAHMARITWQLPVRVPVHADVLLSAEAESDNHPDRS